MITPQHRDRTGLFILGFRWSGSGAVVNWLTDHTPLVCPPLGEIMALNYGLTNFLRITEGQALHAESLARQAMWPQRQQWPELFGRSLHCHRPANWCLAGLADGVSRLVLPQLIKPVWQSFEPRLNAQLRHPYANDREYMEAVKALMNALHEAMARRPRISPLETEAVRRTVNQMFALFYDRWAENEQIPIFDNAITGRTIRYLNLLDSSYFQRRIVIFVRRDPRDQFTELVRLSKGTWAGSVHRFISEYRNRNTEALAYLSRHHDNDEVHAHMIDFEAFVLNPHGVRERLAEDIARKIQQPMQLRTGTRSVFAAQQSQRNIGVWKKGDKLSWQMRTITRQLPTFCTPDAD